MKPGSRAKIINPKRLHYGKVGTVAGVEGAKVVVHPDSVERPTCAESRYGREELRDVTRR